MKKHQFLPLLAVSGNLIFLTLVGCQIQQQANQPQPKTQIITQVLTQVLTQQPTPQPQKPADPFIKTDGYWHGTIILTGYLKIDQRVCNPGDMCSKTVDYASFVFDKADQNSVYDFIKERSGNAFNNSGEIGIGCYEKAQNKIISENDASSNGIDISTLESQIAGNELVKLLAATKQKPVQLQMTMPLMKSGRGAPDCYSIFRNFKVL